MTVDIVSILLFSLSLARTLSIFLSLSQSLSLIHSLTHARPCKYGNRMGRSWMESIGDADGRSKRNSKISKTGSIEGGESGGVER